MAAPNVFKAFASPLKSLRTEIKCWSRQRHVHLRVAAARINTLGLSVHPPFSMQSPRPNARPSFNSPQQIPRTYFSQMTDIVFPDPARPDLFYHFVNPPTPLSHTTPAFALSFLETTPPSVDSPIIIGWLPAQTYSTDSPDNSGSSQSRDSSSTLQDFVVNQKFLALLHDTIKSALEQDLDDVWMAGAMALGKGWMHVHDQRNVPALGRIGDPDDILATVLVEDGKIIPGTYQSMPSYRICTIDGVLKLTPGLEKHLREKLVEVAKGGSA